MSNEPQFSDLLTSQQDGLAELLNQWGPTEVADYSELVSPLIGLLAEGESAVGIANNLRTQLSNHYGLTEVKPQFELGLMIVKWASSAVAEARGYFVSAERLGWPRRGSFGAQHGLQFPINPNQPTAMCHIQTDVDDSSLCGHPVELLGPVPLAPLWHSILPALRCDACDEAAGELTSDEVDEPDYLGQTTQS